MVWLLLVLVLLVLIGAVWYGSRGPADGKDDGSWDKYTGGDSGNFQP